jgi:hypothetical protein
MAVGLDERSSPIGPPPSRWWMARVWSRAPHHGFPEYDGLWPQFAGDVVEMTGLCAADGRPPPAISECELSYVNPITAVEPWPHNSRAERLLLQSFGGDADGLLPVPDDVVADARFSMPPRGAAPAGKMTVEMHWVSVEGPGQAVGMTLSARCRVPDGLLSTVHAFFDNALEWIILGFAALTDAAPVGAPEPGALHRVR